MNISEAMSFKRQITSLSGLDVKMLDTSEEGMVLTIEKRAVNTNKLGLITDFVNQHNLNLLSENGRYFISAKAFKTFLIALSVSKTKIKTSFLNSFFHYLIKERRFLNMNRAVHA